MGGQKGVHLHQSCKLEGGGGNRVAFVAYALSGGRCMKPMPRGLRQHVSGPLVVKIFLQHL